MEPDDSSNLPNESRREFIKNTASKTVALRSIALSPLTALDTVAPPPAPWHRRTLRWGQTNITELDPTRYDIAWWRKHWKRTQTQGVIINAGGIVAYYPSRYPLQHRAESLQGRDLYGELANAAHEDGLAVLARMDSNRADEAFYRAHPDWFAVDSGGAPYRAGELYVACVNSPYYEEYIPSILREIIERTRPEGFADNSWSGLGRSSICYCVYCSRSFKDKTGHTLPARVDWDDEVYRRWIEWNYARRLEIWNLNNRVTRAAGGPDCLWIGMNSGSISGQSASFRDYKEICLRAEMVLLDHQSRNDASGFQHNGEAGKLIHGLLGWDKPIPESMAMYQAGKPTFRLSSKPEPEARMWMLDGIAGGLQPWWHHVGAYHEDRRMYRTAEPVYRWHRKNEEYLIDRRPIATVGVVWSQRNTDYYGRSDPETMVELPWRGISQALIRARIPYLPVHVDHIERDASQFSVLILPDLAAMSDSQLEAVRKFVNRGGGLLATGNTSLFDEWGDPRPDFGLADLYGARHLAPRSSDDRIKHRKWAAETQHTYLRLSPELRARVDGPHPGKEPTPSGSRHAILRGFEETDILPYGGMLEPLRIAPSSVVPLTFVPPFPIYPPETAWMREPRTTIPGLILNTPPGSGRVAYLPADLDRRYGRDNLPDHGDLLENLVRWVARDRIPLEVKGPGLIDCHLYEQPGRTILHMVNLTSAATWRAPVEELIPVGPFRIRVRLPSDPVKKVFRQLVAGTAKPFRMANGWALFEVPSVTDHEVLVIGDR